MAKWVHVLGNADIGSGADSIELLGAKGAGLAEMAALGLPVPAGFVLTRDAFCHVEANGAWPQGLAGEIDAGLKDIERLTGCGLGNATRPLVLVVRPSPAEPVPGLSETLLGIGLDESMLPEIGGQDGVCDHAWRRYRRFVETYGAAVVGADPAIFDDIEDDPNDWKETLRRVKKAAETASGQPFPTDPRKQLTAAIEAFLANAVRRRMVGIPGRGHSQGDGLAIVVQAMVATAFDDFSGKGWLATRDATTGEKRLAGHFSLNADDSGIVGGPLTSEAATASGKDAGLSLEERMPEVFAALSVHAAQLESYFRDAREIAFAVDRGRLWLLATRSARRGVTAAIRISADLADEGLISTDDAVMRIDPASVDHLLHSTIDPEAQRTIVATGLPASPGAATGEIVLTGRDAANLARKGRPAILVRVETSPDDANGMHAAVAIVATRGGMTSHAAVVARGMGKPCVTSARGLRIDLETMTVRTAAGVFKAGDLITVDGSSGEVLAGAVATVRPQLSGDFARLMQWADAARRLKVRANAETAADAQAGRAFGAEGIGLCRTEHMFFETMRIGPMRRMILAERAEDRRAALDELLPMQRADFVELFEIMKGLPVTIRLLDPPLHEFLPKTDREIATVAASMDLDARELGQRVGELAEANPMLGHRGCRLAVSYPEVAEMQARAIFEAAGEASAKTGVPVIPEIMVPLVGAKRELDYVKDLVDTVAVRVEAETGRTVDYLVGTMIELPRAALRAGVIAETAEFFSFGTNDLTQTTFGISRDDAAAFLPDYLAKGILEHDPFVSIDVEGVGTLVRLAADSGRLARPAIKLGLCGEHGGDDDSIRFCEETGLDYVSCSPYRVPIARLAAAQAAIEARRRQS